LTKRWTSAFLLNHKLRKSAPGPLNQTFLYPREANTVKKFLLDETGLELSEYAVAAALVAIAVVGAFTALGTAIGDKITSLGTTISK
jgi:pilus assembly protein Flp/PilA